MGGDLRHLDQKTLDLLTNKAVLAVNQTSSDNEPHFVADGTRVWTAKATGTRDYYLALFNTTAGQKEVRFKLSTIGISGAVGVTDLWTGAELGKTSGVFAASLPSHGAGLYRLTA